MCDSSCDLPPECLLLFGGCIVGAGVGYALAKHGMEPGIATGAGIGACFATYAVEGLLFCAYVACTENPTGMTGRIRETVRNRFNFSTSEAVPVLPTNDSSTHVLAGDVLLNDSYGTVAPMGRSIG